MNTHLFVVMVSIAFASSLWALVALCTIDAAPVQRYLEALVDTGVLKAPSGIGGNEGSEGYSRKTLDKLRDTFYSIEGLTHDVPVRNIHSHNDYWRPRPLLHALSHGVRSVEADVWYFKELDDPKLYVGHSLNALSPKRTLESLYVNPLEALLEGSNPPNGLRSTINELTKDKDLGEFENEVRSPSGVFETDSHATLYFLIDFKTDGRELFDVVHKALEPLRAKGWLSYYDVGGDVFHWGPVTVVGTGNTPLDMVLNQGPHRDLFFDGPLDTLTQESQYTISVSPIVSSSLKNLLAGESVHFGGLSKDQYARASKQIDMAHQLGVATRVWDTPSWPPIREDTVWRQLLKAGSDLLNADNLQKASAFV